MLKKADTAEKLNTLKVWHKEPLKELSDKEQKPATLTENDCLLFKERNSRHIHRTKCPLDHSQT